MSRLPLRLAGRGGVAAVVALPIVMFLLTLVEADFLRSQGWSPVGRTETQWPSLLALGPGGWLMSAAFAVSAIATFGVAHALWSVATDRRGRILAALVALGSVGLAGVTFPADPPGGEATWHAAIHNGLYPLIPLTTIVAAVLCAVAPPAGRWLNATFVRVSRLLAPLMVVFILATSIDPVAQLARYFAFASFLTWLGLLSWRLTTTEFADGDGQGGRRHLKLRPANSQRS